MAKKNINKKASNVPVVQNITVQPPMRKSFDITDWRNATIAAESQIPRRVYLYDLYHDISTTDGQVIAVWSKRQDAVTTANWEFTDKDGNPVDEINELIDSIGFEDLLKEIIDSKAWGYSMCEASFRNDENGHNELSIFRVPKKHMRPEKGVVVKHQNDDEGININEGIYAKTVMKFGKVNDLGLFLSAAMYSIYKRGDISDWAEFIEIFGRGIIDAEWDGFDENQRKNLSRAIREMGSGGVIIRPSGTKVEVKNNTGNANGQLQDAFATKMDGYISKVLLGTTETTESSKTSGYAQAETHSKQDAKKNLSDVQFVRRYLNTEFIKVLKAAGFDTKGGTFVLKTDENLDKEAFEIHKSMKLDLNVPIDDDFFYENYGVRKPDEYETLKNQLKTNVQAAENPPSAGGKNARTPQSSSGEKNENPTPSGIGKGKDPTLLEDEGNKNLSWLRRVLRLFQAAPAVTPNAGAIQTACCGSHLTTIKMATFADEKKWQSLRDELIKDAWDADGALQFHAGLFEFTSNALTNAFIKGWRTPPTKLMDLGFVYDVDDPATLTAYEMNLFRFAGVKTLYQAQMLNEIFRGCNSFQMFYDNVIDELENDNVAWLETEYNAALVVGEMAATYSRLIKQTSTFPFWQYKTIGDSHVRYAHELLDGVTLPWNDPAWDRIFPPNGWNCRCWIVPRTEAEVTPELIKSSIDKVAQYYTTDEFKKSAKTGWAVNRVKKGQVFLENQSYTRNYLGAREKMDRLTAKDWKLKPLEGNYNNLPFEPKFTIDEKDKAVESFFASCKKLTSKRYGLTDYNNRQITIFKSTIKVHTNTNKEKYKYRHLYLNEIPNIIRQPDEVWMHNYKDFYDCYVYLKYYQNEALYVVCTLNDDLSLKIETWYEYDANYDDGRHGLLVYRKSR